MKKLLMVQTCASGAEISKRLWPFWKDCGADRIVFVVGDKPCWVPDGVEAFQSGVDKYVDRDNPDDNLPRRLMDGLRFFLDSDCDLLCKIEYDALVTELPDEWHNFQATWFGTEFCHSPYLLDVWTAKEMLSIGEGWLASGKICGGWPDRFAAQIIITAGIPIVHTGNWSTNTIDTIPLLAEARAAFKRGAWGIHGIKTPEVLEMILA